jgi:diguanylate cyclase (GGDEF)-like protein
MLRKTSQLTITLRVIGSLLSKVRAIFQPDKQAAYALVRKARQWIVRHWLTFRRHLHRLVNRLGQWRGRRGSHHLQSGEKRRWSFPFRYTRSMVGDILIMQLVFTCFLGLLAIGGLWMISQAVIQDNLQRWAYAWITELEDLGAPLYKSEDNERFLRIENYIANFPEITLVRYYTPDGTILFSDTSMSAPEKGNLPRLSDDQLDRLRATTDTDKPYLLDTSMEHQSLFQVSAPVLIESMTPGDLLNLDFESTPVDEVELIGYVELGLDFSRYQDRLVYGITLGSIVLAVALLLLALTGRYLLKRAFKPLSDLEIPLARLAAGETEVKVRSTRHKEIKAINSALQTTICALNERDKVLRRLADYDELTGLPNRRYFTQGLEDEITWVRRCGKTSALLFIDLDQFKYINDTLGHVAGDRVLIQSAGCLQGNLRKNDLIARFGGDEFTIVLKDINKEDAVQLVENLMRIIRDTHFVEDGQPLNVLCSIGVTMIDSGRFTPDELFSQADFACHEAKALGRNRYHCYELSGWEQHQMSADIGWSQKIKNALKDNSLLLHYQPIIHLNSGLPTMYEVLVRMRDENNKIIPPAAFLPAASRFGLMVDIDRLVIRNAMEALARFRKQGHDIKFTLNLSGYVFNDANLVDFIRENLEKNGLDPSMVIFEVTEQVAVQNLEQACGLIQEIMALGCRFALDDFGTGFSSFNYLKHIPVDYIKIDGSFITNMAKDQVDQAMVKSIIQIANAIGKQTIAEYVEDGETLSMLQELGVDYAQGFHIGEPAETLLGKPMDSKAARPDEIKWKEFQDDYIRVCVRWYLRDKPSYRQLEAMMLERGVPVRRTTIGQWVRRFMPETDEHIEPMPEPVNMDYCVVETLVLVKKQRKYLYRAISPDGTTLDFILYDTSGYQEAEQFFRSRLQGRGTISTVAAGTVA